MQENVTEMHIEQLRARIKRKEENQTKNKDLLSKRGKNEKSAGIVGKREKKAKYDKNVTYDDNGNVLKVN